MTMPTDLLAELTHETVDSSRRRAGYVSTFVSSLEAEGQGVDRSAVELTIQEVVADTAQRSIDAQRLWNSLFERLKIRPTRSSLVMLVAREIVQLAEEWQGLEVQIRRLLDFALKMGITINDKGVRELDDAARKMAKVRAEAEMIVAGLNRPRAEIDSARLAKGRKEAAEGRGVKSEEAIAAIRAARK